MSKLDKNKVSLGKIKVEGVVYVAPSATTLPTDATSALDGAFKNLGYVSADGITNSVETSETAVKDMGGSTVLKEISAYGESYKFNLLQIDEDVLKTFYGTANVTGSDEDALKVLHRQPTGESQIYVFELLLTGGRIKRIVVPDGTVSKLGDIKYSASGAISYPVTVTANPSSQIENASSVEYIAKKA